MNERYRAEFNGKSSEGGDPVTRGNRNRRNPFQDSDIHPRSKTSKYGYSSASESKGYQLISFEVDVVNLADYIAKTVVSKQKDYGPANIMKSPFGPEQGLIVRLYDKVARLANLTKKESKPENESLRDTFVDIAGYAIIGLMVLDGTFPKE
jgi:hypothetical protein